MKIQKIVQVLLLLFIGISGLTNCSNDSENEVKIFHLSFEKNYYERPMQGAKSIMIRGGNRDYTITVENPEILEATVDLSSLTGMGNLNIYPKQIGETIVKVHDNIINETVNLTIKIVYSYLNLVVAAPIQSPYKSGDRFFLINNNESSFYLYDEDWELKSTGKYHFSTENNTPYMELIFKEKFDGRNIYKYDLSNTSQEMFYAIKALLDWDWHDFTKSPGTRESAPITMNATDTETGVQYYFFLGNNDMPENVLE